MLLIETEDIARPVAGDVCAAARASTKVTPAKRVRPQGPPGLNSKSGAPVHQSRPASRPLCRAIGGEDRRAIGANLDNARTVMENQAWVAEAFRSFRSGFR
jgi:hypothetical protein